MYVISLLGNTRLGVGTLIIATSSAINKKITLQSTSATNVASVAFAIKHKNNINYSQLQLITSSCRFFSIFASISYKLLPIGNYYTDSSNISYSSTKTKIKHKQ